MSGAPAPKFVFRGHQAAVHAAAFLRDNERLATGDSQGFVVLWDLIIMRARAVWKAHENAILGLCGWGRDKIITWVVTPLSSLSIYVLMAVVHQDLACQLGEAN